MISENRDILLERLEQQLAAKERDNNELRNSLKDSIISELRDSMKEDFDFDKRISILERRVRENGLAYEGVMKELLDQKVVIQDMKKKNLNNNKDEKKHIHSEIPPVKDGATKHPTQFIIAKSEEDTVPNNKNDKNTRISKKEKSSDIIVADQCLSKHTGKGEVIVEAREDEDVVIEYRK